MSMPQGARVEFLALTPVETLAVYVGLPAVLFSAIVLLVLLASRPSRPSGFPVLQPGRTPANNSGSAQGPPQPETPPASVAPLVGKRPRSAPSTAQSEENRGQVPT